MARFTDRHIDTWARDGGVLIEHFFSPQEVSAVVADFARVFERTEGAATPKIMRGPGEFGKFSTSQFSSFAAIPFIDAPALNLIGVHPQLIAFAKAALGAPKVYLYQCQAWAKFTGEADYEQPLHCDFVNHTLTVPSDQAVNGSVTILCYFTDVSQAHGPMYYVTRPDSQSVAGCEAILNGTEDLQHALQPLERSSAAPAGSIFPYSIDVYHRGSNLTAPGGKRYAVMACFKASGNDHIGYHSWPYHQTHAWQDVFARATPEQLECFGVQPPGDPFWTETTLKRAQIRYPDWDLSPYTDALDS